MKVNMCSRCVDAERCIDGAEPQTQLSQGPGLGETDGRSHQTAQHGGNWNHLPAVGRVRSEESGFC